LEPVHRGPPSSGGWARQSGDHLPRRHRGRAAHGSRRLVQLGSGGARDLFDLGLAIAGRGTLQKDLRIELAPTIETPLGPMRYAMPVTVRRSTDVTRASE
jgi:hypothetical protein